MAQSEAAKRASAKYDRENTISFIVKLNKKTDADIIAFFSELDRSRMGFIKEAVREKMQREGK